MLEHLINSQNFSPIYSLFVSTWLERSAKLLGLKENTVRELATEGWMLRSAIIDILLRSKIETSAPLELDLSKYLLVFFEQGQINGRWLYTGDEASITAPQKCFDRIDKADETLLETHFGPLGANIEGNFTLKYSPDAPLIPYSDLPCDSADGHEIVLLNFSECAKILELNCQLHTSIDVGSFGIAPDPTTWLQNYLEHTGRGEGNTREQILEKMQDECEITLRAARRIWDTVLDALPELKKKWGKPGRPAKNKSSPN